MFLTAQQWGTADAEEVKSRLMRTQSLKVLPLKPGVGQYIAMHTRLTTRNFFLANFYPSGPFTCIFFQNLSLVFTVLAVANTGSCVGPRNKLGHPAGCRFPCEFSRNINRLQNMCYWGFFLLVLRSEIVDRI